MTLRRSKTFSRLAFAGIFCAGVTGLFGGEKIQLSVPQKKDDFQIEQKDLNQKSSGQFDAGKPNSDTIAAPTFFSTPRYQPRDADEDDKRKNWIFATPEKSTPTAEEAFKVKNYDSGQGKNSDPTFFGHRIPDSQSAKKQEKSDQAENAANTDARDKRGQSQNLLNSAWLRSENPSMPEKNLNQLERPGAFSEYWGEKLHLYDSGNNDRDLTRRTEFNQMFQNRGQGAGFVNALGNDLTRQPVNPVTAAPDDLLGRSSQSSLSREWKDGFQSYNGSRGSQSEDMNSRALGRIQSPLDSKPVESVTVRPQPAVLPFPTRPGELFRRPGSF
jgi:hypothetical protein